MEISVYMNFEAFTGKKPVFARRLDSSDVDFSMLLSALKVLFGDRCVVQFLCT